MTASVQNAPHGPTLPRVLTAIVAVAAVALYFTPPPAGVPVTTMHAGAVLLLAIGLWAVGSVPEHIVALMFLLLAMLLAIAPASVVFSGFESGTLWLVLGGLVIAEAVRATGLGERFAQFLFSRVTLTYRGLIVACVVIAIALAFAMPATVARVLLLLPIYMAMAERLGLKPGSNGHTGVCLAAIMTSYQCGTAVLTANAPNLVLAGAAETLYGVSLHYADYLLVQFPVIGIVKGLLIVVFICRLFPDETRPAAGVRAVTPMSAEEKRLAVILAVALLLWVTDFLHGIRAAWVGLAAAVIALLPRVGVVPVATFPDRVRLGSFFYVGGVLGFGAVLFHSGVGDAVGRVMLGLVDLQPGHDATNFIALTLLATVTGLFTTHPSQPALFAPLAESIVAATGWPLEAALMTSAVGFSTLILPYQAPPVMVGMAMAGLSLRAMLRLAAPLAAISVILLIPLNYFWWLAIGYFG